jgi:DNA polymerase-3 subunit beta
MNLYINREHLVRGLQRVQGVIERGTSNAALSHVLLSTTPAGALRMRATDTQNTLIADYEAAIKADGEIAVDAQHFFQIARTLPDATVSLSLSAAGTRLQIGSGKALFNLNTLSADEFPPTPIADSTRIMKVTGAHLRQLIEETVFSISADDNRYGLNGAFLERVVTRAGEQRARMATTDGSRLSYTEVPFEGEVGMGRKVLLPRKALNELAKLAADDQVVWDVSFSDRSVTFRGGAVTLMSRLVEGEFPDYKQILPESFRRCIEVDRADFLNALRRVSLVATDRNHSVRFTFQRDALVLSADNLDLGDAREEVPAKLEGEGFSTGFNIKYFQDLLAPTSSERLSLEIGDVLDPCIVQLSGRDDCKFIVMPMRLD